jgi:hypothetical protein
MDSKHIQILLERLGCEKIRVSSDWVKATCPLAPWRHTKGTDRRPSFAVAVDVENHSGAKCHACNFSGSLLTLIWRMRGHTGTDITALMKFVGAHDEISEEVLAAKVNSIPDTPPQWKEVAGIKVSPTHQPSLPLGQALELPPLEESSLDAFKTITDEAWSWFEKRGLSVNTVKEWELGWHPQARRISIPVRDVKGRLVCVSGRAMDSWQQPKFLHSKGFRRDFYLYGEHRCQTPGVGYLVEGFFDAIALWQKGYRNAFCFMGPGVSKFQVEKIVEFCTEVVIVPDGDAPGKEIAERVLTAVQPRLWKTRVIEVPDGTDPDELPGSYLNYHLGPPQALPAH